MASVVKISQIQNANGNVLLDNGYPRQPGRIIEVLTSPCDGSEVKVGSGIYDFENVTTQQATTTSYQRITGSLMSYDPPVGATRVTYNFQFNTYWGATHAINHYKFFIDDEEVYYARHSRNGYYNEDRAVFEWTMSIGKADTPNINYGQVSRWTQPRNLYMMVRQYGGSNFNNIHGTYYWDGGASNQLGIPILTITAFA
jgi:hypothetical protein